MMRLQPPSDLCLRAMPERLDRDWLNAHGRTELVCHFNMGDQHHSTYRIVDGRTGEPLGLTFSSTSYKRSRRNGDKAGTTERTWYVASHLEPIASLDEALEIFRIIRLAREEAHHG